MTTTRSSWKFVWLGVTVGSCATARPPAPHETSAVAVSSAAGLRPAPMSSSSNGAEQAAEQYRGWIEIGRGVGNGHALPNVHISNVTISTNNELSRQYYCETRPLDAGATFGVVEALALGDERTLYYIIERTQAGDWQYRVRFDGETVAGSPACATCHDQGKLDPFFRPFRDVACP